MNAKSIIISPVFMVTPCPTAGELQQAVEDCERMAAQRQTLQTQIELDGAASEFGAQFVLAIADARLREAEYCLKTITQLRTILN